jgi:uncharacterized membrane protein
MDMKTISKNIEIDLPVTTVYNQWTQFEEFPKFMEGVNKVVQTDDKHLHWETEIGLAEREFDAEITEQTPDQVIAWRALGDTKHVGRVTFEPLSSTKTRVNVEMAHAPSNFVEKAADVLGIVGTRIQGDLKRFKSMIEERGTETGAWRGDVDQSGKTTDLK